MQVWEEGGAYSVHVTVLPAKNFIGGTLSLCVFMPWMLLPVDGCLRVCVRIPRNAYFTWRTTEIRVDAEMRSIDAKCSHFSQSFFLRVSRYYEHPLSCLRAPQLHRICYSTDDEINILYPVYIYIYIKGEEIFPRSIVYWLVILWSISLFFFGFYFCTIWKCVLNVVRLKIGRKIKMVFKE